jgi:hypothetical protein
MINPRLRGGGKIDEKEENRGLMRRIIRNKRKNMGKRGEEGPYQAPGTTFDFQVGPTECCNIIFVKEDGRETITARCITKNENVPLDIRLLKKILLEDYWFKTGYKIKKWKTTYKYGIEQEYYEGFELYDDGISVTRIQLMKDGASSADIFLNKQEPNFDSDEKGTLKKLTYMAVKDNLEGESWVRKYKTEAWIHEGTIGLTSKLVRKYDEEKWTFLMDGEEVKVIDGKLQCKVKENFEFNDIHKLLIFKSAESEIEPLIRKIERKIEKPIFTKKQLLLPRKARITDDEENPEVPRIAMNQLRIIKAESMLKNLASITDKVLTHHKTNQDNFNYRTRVTELDSKDMKRNYSLSEEEEKLEFQISDTYNWKKDHELKKL